MMNLGLPGHWKLLPQLDPRGGGQLYPGHTVTTPCAGCCAPKNLPTPPAARPTVPVRGDRKLPPTLRPLAGGFFDRPPPAPDREIPPVVSPLAALADPQGPTVRQAIVMALASLGPGEHDVNALVVRAWKRFPASFGLRGYIDLYPDSSRVLAKLSGADGVVGTGHCVRVGGGRIRLTPYGAMRARQMEAEHGGRGVSGRADAE